MARSSRSRLARVPLAHRVDDLGLLDGLPERFVQLVELLLLVPEDQAEYRHTSRDHGEGVRRDPCPDGGEPERLKRADDREDLGRHLVGHDDDGDVLDGLGERGEEPDVVFGPLSEFLQRTQELLVLFLELSAHRWTCPQN